MVAQSPLHAVLVMRHLLALVFVNFVMGGATLPQAVTRALPVLPGASLSLVLRLYWRAKLGALVVLAMELRHKPLHRVIGCAHDARAGLTAPGLRPTTALRALL